MAKKQSTTTKSETQSQGTFRQFFRAFRRRVSPARPLAANRADIVKPSTSNNKVLIDYNHSNNNNVKPMKPGPANIHHQPRPKGVKFEDGYNNNNSASNEKFSDFIDETKKKIRANSSFVGDENGGIITKRATTRRDSFNDRVSHFINRAKLKMRTTTIVADTDHVDGNVQPR